MNTLEKSQVFLAGTVLARRGGIRHSGPGRRPCDRHALDVSADRSYRMRRLVSVRRRFVHARPDCRQQRYHRRKQQKAAACAEPSRDASAKDRCAGAINRVCTGSPLTRSSIEESVAKNQMPAKYGHLVFYASAALEAHDVASEYLLARSFRRVLRCQRLFGVVGFGLGRDGRKRFSDARAVRVVFRKAPPERAVAELLAGRNFLRKVQRLALSRKEAACVVLLGRV